MSIHSIIMWSLKGQQLTPSASVHKVAITHRGLLPNKKVYLAPVASEHKGSNARHEQKGLQLTPIGHHWACGIVYQARKGPSYSCHEFTKGGHHTPWAIAEQKCILLLS